MRKQSWRQLGMNPLQRGEVSDLPMHPKPWALVSCSQARHTHQQRQGVIFGTWRCPIDCQAASKRMMDAISTSMRLLDRALQSPACPWPAAEACGLSLLLCWGSSAGNMYVMAITLNAHSALWRLRKLVRAISLQSVCHKGVGPRLTRMPRGPRCREPSTAYEKLRRNVTTDYRVVALESRSVRRNASTIPQDVLTRDHTSLR